jgi:PAS domain S-box-containing protein
MFDASLVVTLYNEAAERMFCRPAGQAIGRPVTELFPAVDREKTVRLLCNTHLAPAPDECATGAPDTRSVLVLTGRRATGEDFPLEATVSSIDLRGTPAYTMIARDVTERRRQEDALKDQAASLAKSARELEALNAELSTRQQELVQAMSARSRFYASMSHELRTPINAIIGYNTLLLDEIYGPLNEKQAHGIQRTHKAAKHLLELVNDVLDLSKIEAGKIELSLQPVTFPMTVEDLFVTVRPLADEHKTTLSGEHVGAPVTVVTDPRRVRQILLNLLSNAIKFGRGRPIMVRSETLPDGGVTIAVIDEGYGIAAEDMPRIFDEFVQLEHSKQHGGTGLGLPISRRLATMLGGSLTVESVVDQGSTFRLTLPASAETRPAKRESGDGRPPRDGGPQRPDKPRDVPDGPPGEAGAAA